MHKILIMDDEEPIVRLLSFFLREKGYEPLTAQTGQEALDILTKEKPFLVLLDIHMPDIDGLSVLQMIRKTDPSIGVIMASGIRDGKIAEEAARLGSYAYVVKPFDLKYLETLLRTYELFKAA